MVDKFDPSKMMEHINEFNSDVVKEISIDALETVVNESPVLEGHYKANHVVSLNSTSSTTTESTDKSGSSTISKGKSTIESIREFGDNVYIQNNLPYADRIEHGWSDQAPQGVYTQAAQKASR